MAFFRHHRRDRIGIVAFYLVALFGRSGAEAHEQTRGLLPELEATRDAEAEAGGCASAGDSPARCTTCLPTRYLD